MTNQEWILDQLIKYQGDLEAVKNLYPQFKKTMGSKASKASYDRRVREGYEQYLTNIVTEDSEHEWEEEDYIRAMAQKQRMQDKNRVINKEKREHYRVFNFLDEMYGQYEELMTSVDLSKVKLKKQSNKKCKTGVLHLSDFHLNERISAYEGVDNEYSFTIASKRLKKFVSEAKEIFKMKGVNNVLVVNTGDNINSDRRLSEKMTKISSLTRSSLLATQLLSQVIVDIGTDFSVSFAGVVGNESRIGDYYENVNMLLAENWDYLIYENLRLMFSGNKNFTFIEGDPKEKMVSIGGFNCLIIHGDNFSNNNPEKSVREFVSKYTIKGVPVHGVFSGHIHSSLIGDFYSRCSGLVGANPYSNKGLGLYGRSSQNIYFVNDDNSYTGMKIDLQDTEGVDGYNISEELKRYNIEESGENTEVIIKKYKA